MSTRSLVLVLRLFGAAALLKTRNSTIASQTFVHLFEWPWDDVATECEEWLGPKGFAAVQISPPNEHNAGDGWNERYKPVTYNLTSRSGNESQFVSMVQRCKAAGVDIYADVVINQMAPYSGVGIAGSPYGHRSYPVFKPDDFHHVEGDTTHNCGVDNYQDEHNVQYCDLLGMPDLCTGCSHVQDVVAEYIHNMQGYGINGIRIDAAKHINSEDLQGLFSKVDPHLFRFLEVLKMAGEAVKPEEYFGLGKITEIGYGSTLGSKFKSEGKLWGDLETLGAPWGLMPAEHAVVFLDNHDTQRNSAILTFKDGKLYSMANVFMLAWPYGYPKVMSSYHFTDAAQGPPSTPIHSTSGVVNCGEDRPWVCEHRWPDIANMVAWRKIARDLPVTNFSLASGEDYGNGLSFCRGAVACVAFNRWASKPWVAELKVSLPAGKYCNALTESAECEEIQVMDDGTVKLTIPPLSSVAFHIASRG